MKKFLAGIFITLFLIAGVNLVQANTYDRQNTYDNEQDMYNQHKVLGDLRRNTSDEEINFDDPDSAHIVAFYTSGRHEIPGEENDNHYGNDIVMRSGKSGNFQQWFYGTSDKKGLHGEHTVWKVKKGNDCQNGWMEIRQAYPQWGDYLEPNTDYCVKTNEFHVNK
jgi:hypothetical protein